MCLATLPQTTQNICCHSGPINPLLPKLITRAFFSWNLSELSSSTSQVGTMIILREQGKSSWWALAPLFPRKSTGGFLSMKYLTNLRNQCCLGVYALGQKVSWLRAWQMESKILSIPQITMLCGGPSIISYRLGCTLLLHYATKGQRKKNTALQCLK